MTSVGGQACGLYILIEHLLHQPVTADCTAAYFVEGQQPLFLLLLM